MVCSKSSSKKEVNTVQAYLKKQDKFQKITNNFKPKESRKRRTNKTQSKQQEGNNENQSNQKRSKRHPNWKEEVKL